MAPSSMAMANAAPPSASSRSRSTLWLPRSRSGHVTSSPGSPPAWLPASFGAYALEALPDGERDSMAWIADNTPPGSVFLVLSPKSSWETDYVLEWFPALAGRRSGGGGGLAGAARGGGHSRLGVAEEVQLEQNVTGKSRAQALQAHQRRGTQVIAPDQGTKPFAYPFAAPVAGTGSLVSG